VCIQKAQDILRKENLQADLAFIHAHLSFLPKVIKAFEKGGLTLLRGLEMVSNTKLRIEAIPGAVGQALKTKLAFVLNNNPGMKALEQVGCVLRSEEGPLPEGMEPQDVALLKFCPMASADVERSFSVYKSTFTDENLKKTIVSHCFFTRLSRE